ncbi:MAG: hemerythrin domain-containing protein [Planctomycetota bacterium]|jgi:hemerythrin-like domain-containing protein
MQDLPTTCGSTAATPTSILSAEHRVIESVLDALVAMTEKFAETGSLQGDDARSAIEFIRTFADKCHHGKEEDRLFPLMDECNQWPEGQGPTQCMRDEHVQGRNHVSDMAAAVDGDDVGGFCSAARAFNALLREHILKEDEMLFPMAAQMLADRDAELLESFREFEHKDLGEGTHQRMLEVAKDLCAKYGVSAPPTDGCACGH